MDDQVLSDISELLLLCQNEKRWPRGRAIIEDIEARYSEQIIQHRTARMQAAGWVREGNGWTKTVSRKG